VEVKSVSVGRRGIRRRERRAFRRKFRLNPPDATETILPVDGSSTPPNETSGGLTQTAKQRHVELVNSSSKKREKE
jgi:hypothetical protein